MAANEFKTQFIKINKNTKNQIRKGYGHSQMKTNNFSRRNSVAKITDSSSKSVRTSVPVTVDILKPTTAMTNNYNNSILNKRNNSNTLMQSQQSWSMANLKKTDEQLKKRINYEFTEQRCNYERMSQKQQQQQIHRPWSSEQVIRCNISNSRIPTYTIDQNQNKNQHNFNFNAINEEFLALNEFRMQNSKDCFSDRHYRLLQLRAQTPSNNSLKSSDRESILSDDYELSWWFNDLDDINRCNKQLKNNENLKKSLTTPFSSLSLSPMPYAARQRFLKEQLEKESPCRKLKSNILDINKSTALSYQSKF